MPIDNLLWYAGIAVFQSTKLKSLNKVYTDRSVNSGNQELSVVYLSICTLLLTYASVIFNGIVNNFEKFKFPVFLNIEKMPFLLSLKVFSTFTFTFKHFVINKSINCYSSCYLLVAVMLNQIQELKRSIRFPSVTGI